MTIIGLASSPSSGSALANTVSACQTDDEIPAGKAEGAMSIAMPFAEAILQGRATAAYQNVSNEMASKVSAQAFSDMVQSLASNAPYAVPTVAHAYRVGLKAEAPQPVVCGTLSDPNAWVAATSIPAPEQFHFLFASRSRNNDWAIHVWLIPTAQGWKVQGFYVGMQTTGGRNARELFALARAQRAKNHLMNAALLYATVHVLINRGDAFQLGLTQELTRDTKTFVGPAELSGKPPFYVTWAHQKFIVDQFTVVGIGQHLYLTLYHTDPTWDGSDLKAAEALNRRLIEAFRAVHPEYKEVFSGMVVRLLRSDKSGGFGTVFEERNQKAT